MKLCYFNYFLKEGERIISTFECRLKTINAFQILDKEGILVATNFRLLFCKVIGEHPHFNLMIINIYVLLSLKRMESIYMQNTMEIH